ncbi:MAG: hypothetical protein SOR95_08480 [Sutterella sp.]|nr:hypothetical protein [Sutterella sp.]
MPIITNIILKGQRYEIVDAHSGYVTRQVDDLANYYLKSEVDTRLSAIPKFAITVVSSLPTSNISPTTVYLVKSGDESNNLFEEFIYVNNAWEKLGTQQVDLTPYARTDDMMAQLSTKASGADLSSLQSVVATKADRTELQTVNATLSKLSADFFAQESWVTDQFALVDAMISNLTTGELTQYVKTVDADNTYATKTALSAVDGKFANYTTTTALTDALVPYAKSADVANTYATTTALNAVDGKFANYTTTSTLDTKLGLYLLKTDAETAYATKSELVAVNGSLETKVAKTGDRGALSGWEKYSVIDVPANGTYNVTEASPDVVHLRLQGTCTINFRQRASTTADDPIFYQKILLIEVVSASNIVVNWGLSGANWRNLSYSAPVLGASGDKVILWVQESSSSGCELFFLQTSEARGSIGD